MEQLPLQWLWSRQPYLKLHFNPLLDRQTDRLVFWMSQQLCVRTVFNCELDMTVLPNVMGVCVCVFSVSPVGAQEAAGGVSGCGTSTQGGPAESVQCAAAHPPAHKLQSRSRRWDPEWQTHVNQHTRTRTHPHVATHNIITITNGSRGNCLPFSLYRTNFFY